jgi:hypothetical protein
VTDDLAAWLAQVSPDEPDEQLEVDAWEVDRHHE